MNDLSKKLISEESGQDLIEYALVAALIGLGAVAALQGVTNSVGNVFNSLGNTFTTPTS